MFLTKQFLNLLLFSPRKVFWLPVPLTSTHWWAFFGGLLPVTFTSPVRVRAVKTMPIDPSDLIEFITKGFLTNINSIKRVFY